MERKLFTEMLNSVVADDLFPEDYKRGLCGWVWNLEGRVARQTMSWQTPDTETGFGILCHFHPTARDITSLEHHGHNTDYWGSDSSRELLGILTDLRATILCFCAAINNEL